MTKQFGRLLLAGTCALIVATASQAADDAERPSHRLLDSDYGDLSKAEQILAQRLNHTQDMQKFHDLVTPLLKDKGVQEMLKGITPEDIEKLPDKIKNSPGLLDSPEVKSLLNNAEQFKNSGGAGLTDKAKKDIAKMAKTLFGQTSLPDFPPSNIAPVGSSDPANPALAPPAIPSTRPAASSESARSEFVQGMTDILKEINQSPEGEALRKAILSDLDEANAEAAKPPRKGDFFHNVISPRQASWLSRNLTLPALPYFDGWSSNGNSSAGPSAGDSASSVGGLDAAAWVVAVTLFGIAALLAWRAANRRAAGAAVKGWSVGPWPVDPSRVSTREDLIRAFEHLAYLCLGPAALPLNHLDVACRLSETAEGRAGPAGRLAHLYEQARYAPSNELLADDELAAARGDLSTLAGVAP